MRKQVIRVANKVIGEGYPCFIVAEAGVNHNGSVKLAKRLIDSAKKVGADAVKFQMFIPSELVTRNAKKAQYQIETTGIDKNQYAMLKRLALSENQFRRLADYAKKVGILLFATIHDEKSLETFENLNLPIIKIASSDCNNGLLLYKIASNQILKEKPLFLSTGGVTFSDVEKSLVFLRENGFRGPILIYHCVASYPTPSNQQNLRVIETFTKILGKKHGLLVGFSDNGDDVNIPVDAVRLGAVSVEKHLTLDKNFEGPDQKISLEHEEFLRMVSRIREVERLDDRHIENKDALGSGVKKIQPSEYSINAVAKKAVRARRYLHAGTKLTLDSLVCKRPQGQVSPMDFQNLLGKSLKRAVRADGEITPEILA